MTDHPISLRNSLTGTKAAFIPLDWQDGSAIPEGERQVRMYVCGPTVYDRAHIGNARPAVAFDVLYRLLRHVYGPAHVKYVRNITDVDDKIMARAAERGVPIDEITAETYDWYQEDMAAVGNMPPDVQPRATQYIDQMQAMIARLIASGHAYAAEGHVLFSVDSYAAYGRLSGRSVEDMIAGARVEVAPYKKNPMDFVLWKPSTPEQQGWDSPWGRGRPGWHIECSAMSEDTLGADFDIHGGGSDLMFPHHENEIAQSCCATPGAGFARVWLHNGMIRIGGQKMSKSLGNFTTVFDLRGHVPGEVIRLALLSTQYRGELDWTDRLAEDCEKALRRWRKATEGAAPGTPDPAVVAALADDLNTPKAIAELHRLAREGDGPTLLASANLMGLLTPELGGWERTAEVPPEVDSAMQQVLAEYAGLRERKSYELADRVRQALIEAGINIQSQGKGEISLSWDLGKAEAYFNSMSRERSLMVFGREKDVPLSQMQIDYINHVLSRVAKAGDQ